jgi:opacity protein-like surface antigen
MRKSVIFLLMLILFAGSAVHSQVKPPTEGSKALLFNFVGLSSLGLDMYQGGIGGKYFLSDEMAVRALLIFGINNQTQNGVAGFTDETTDQFSFGIGGALEYHLPISTHVSPYFGGGISFTTSTTTSTPSVPSGTAAAESKQTTTGFQLGAIGGIEYFFNQNLSLSAEYQFGLSTSSTSQSGNPGSSTLRLGFQSAGLTMAIYF